jgi:CBS domain-containing protein
MDRNRAFVLPSDTARDVARRMRDEELSFLPVCDNAGRVVGGITDRDMAVRLIAEDHPATTHVLEVMRRDYPTAMENDDLAVAIDRAHERPVLVTDASGQLRGVIKPGSRSAPHRAHQDQSSHSR